MIFFKFSVDPNMCLCTDSLQTTQHNRVTAVHQLQHNQHCFIDKDSQENVHVAQVMTKEKMQEDLTLSLPQVRHTSYKSQRELNKARLDSCSTGRRKKLTFDSYSCCCYIPLLLFFRLWLKYFPKSETSVGKATRILGKGILKII